MKKILIILGLVLSAISYGQIKVDTLDYTTAPLSGEYTILFGDYPAKYMKRVRMQYLQPMIYDLTAIRPRLITDNLMLGTSTNYNYKFYVNGTSFFNNTTYNATGVRHYFGSTWIGDVSGQFTIYDPTTGTKTLADLASGTGGTGFSSTETNKITTQSADTGLYVTNAYTGYGILVANSSNGYGVRTINSGPGYGNYVWNTSTSTGTGLVVYNQSTSTSGLYVDNASTGTGLYVRTIATGTAIRVYDWTHSHYVFTVDDSVKINYLSGASTGSRFLVLTSTGAVDSGVLVNASEQLRMKLPSLRKYLNDQKDGELFGYYTKDEKLVKNYGLKDNQTGQSLGLESIEYLQGRIEWAFKFIYRRVLVDNIQWVLIGFLLLWVIRLEIKLRKK
jgi:hypothetical protein